MSQTSGRWAVITITLLLGVICLARNQIAPQVTFLKLVDGLPGQTTGLTEGDDAALYGVTCTGGLGFGTVFRIDPVSGASPLMYPLTASTF